MIAFVSEQVDAVDRAGLVRQDVFEKPCSGPSLGGSDLESSDVWPILEVAQPLLPILDVLRETVVRELFGVLHGAGG